jgi:hypothetical protein
MMLLKQERTKLNSSKMKLTLMLETTTQPKVHQSCQKKMIHQQLLTLLHQQAQHEQYESASKLNTLKL